jgi:plasmid stabilization system protein ParE
MKYNISILISANNDLFEICDTLTEFGDNPPNIFTESFYKFIDDVSNMPLMYPQYTRKPKYRKATLAYNYLAFYQIDKKNKAIKIYRILSGKRNIEDLL